MISIILGTRPEIIKTAPVIRELQRENINFSILHTGQHYSPNMDSSFFTDLHLPAPHHNLNVGNQPYRKQVGLMVHAIRAILHKDKPKIVLLQGDTISVVSGALAASKEHITVAHHEAGLRCHDITMLEETNRIITDHISDYLFAPTKRSIENLKQEGIPDEKIFYTGNTIVDAVQQNIKISKKKSTIINSLGLKEKGYFLVTCHRAENVDKQQRLKGILQGLELVYSKFATEIIFPIHPRTAKRIDEFGLTIPDNIKVIDPPSYLDFLSLENNTKLILTDSGGLQEEASILKVPCVTLRDSTERPETLELRINTLAGTDPERILASTTKMLTTPFPNFENPFGDGKAGERIISILTRSQQ